MNGKPKKFEMPSPFHRATGDRYWHTNFSIPSNDRIREYDWIIRLDGENTFRFVPYALKVGAFPNRQDISFNIRDEGTEPLKGDGSNAVMTLSLWLD